MTLDVGSIINIINIISQLKSVVRSSDEKRELTQLMIALIVYDEVRRLRERVEAWISRLEKGDYSCPDVIVNEGFGFRIAGGACQLIVDHVVDEFYNRLSTRLKLRREIVFKIIQNTLDLDVEALGRELKFCGHKWEELKSIVENLRNAVQNNADIGREMRKIMNRARVEGNVPPNVSDEELLEIFASSFARGFIETWGGNEWRSVFVNNYCRVMIELCSKIFFELISARSKKAKELIECLKEFSKKLRSIEEELYKKHVDRLFKKYGYKIIEYQNYSASM
jgi:hypothetical protein